MPTVSLNTFLPLSKAAFCFVGTQRCIRIGGGTKIFQETIRGSTAFGVWPLLCMIGIGDEEERGIE